MYPTTGAVAVVAEGYSVHTNLLARDYGRVRGNRHQAPSGDETSLAVDLLVLLTTGGLMDTVRVGERGFDAIPG
ncbi:hypothetical protein [Rhodococcus rhodochrous]|uniref:Uncharacterized protein n=1 Tax=Rhodococcus rhodochrous KG-21 TaxID=1441923 RepID=A0A0N0S0U8_RHORH|nr:hypothetical protein [Rhodococcus rhodochrous]KOS55420.1 hypothetical protein Z051_15080 [Rhodococcus rhodochrous KG-21]